MARTLLKVIIVLFAIIGLLAVIGAVGMWSMHGAMMGRGCWNMMGLCCRTMPARP